MKINGEFNDMSEAFAFCRECNRPIIVQVDGKKYRLFPSGRADELPTLPLVGVVCASD